MSPATPQTAGLPAITLVLGGARSGKSRYAERLVEAAATAGTYCATAQAGDAEMAARIAEHRARRGSFWRTVEAPLDLAAVIAAETAPDRPLLVDCLTLWLSNLLLAERPLDAAFGRLHGALRDAAGPVVLVANEVGLGLVPETPLGRHFRDAAGRLNQETAALADRVVFVAAGLPLVLKGEVGLAGTAGILPACRLEAGAPGIPHLAPALSATGGGEEETKGR